MQKERVLGEERTARRSGSEMGADQKACSTRLFIIFNFVTLVSRSPSLVKIGSFNGDSARGFLQKRGKRRYLGTGELGYVGRCPPKAKRTDAAGSPSSPHSSQARLVNTTLG
jgi:hypothetical protein